MKRTLFIAVALAGSFLILVTARVVWSSRHQLLRAREELEQGRLDRAIVSFRRAAHWYAPGNPYCRAAIEHLWSLGQTAEKQGNERRALLAYRAIRSSILAARSFYTPYQDWLKRANERIAVLMARQKLKARAAAQAGGPTKDETGKTAKGETLDPKEYDAAIQQYRRLLERNSLPSVFWSLVALLGLAIWIASGFAFAFRAIDRDDHLQVKPAIFWASAIALGLAIWMAGLALA